MVGLITDIIFGVYALLMPGIFITFTIFPRETIAKLERGALSVLLSLLVTPAMAYLLHELGLRFDRVTILVEITIISLLFASWAYFTGKLSRANKDNK